jgi:hypothetical protein
LQNAFYNQAVKERNQQDVDRLIENVIATNATFFVPSLGKVNVTADLVNAGSISAQILTLWVLDATQQKYNVTDLRTRNINLNPGVRQPFTMVVNILGANSTNFNAWVVTARGNKVNLAETQRVIIADVAQGIGSMSLNFPEFRYFTYASGIRLENYPNGNKNFSVPNGPDIAFGALLTNLDPSKQMITLSKYSLVWLYTMKAPGQQPPFYIVKVSSDGTITSPYSEITVAYRETKLIVFASGNAGSFTKNSIVAAAKDSPAAINLLLLGTIGTRSYAQNIPFVSLYILP